MKDITRIHIAKVPYNIELSAKKELEKYISALEAFTADSELLQDIEIRMTELLLERGVKQDDVIGSADVAAIREQLGEPKEFMTDEAAVVIDAEELSREGVRKLYRDLDTAVIGGVLAGIAHYLRVNALWVRLAFIVLIFVSFGFFVLVYIIGWLIIPAARTAAEKLQMVGRPVTLSSIRELNEATPTGNSERRTAITKRILTTTLGLAAAVTALSCAVGLVVVALQVSYDNDAAKVASLYQLSFVLFYVSGALLTALALLVTFAAFAQKFNKRIWISALVIIVLGLATAGVATAAGVAQHRSEYEAIQRNTIEVTEALPVAFTSVKSLSVDMAGYTNLNYVVDSTAPSLTQRMLKGSPKVAVVVENGTAKISIEAPKERIYGAEATVTVYGPAVESITVVNGYVSYDAGAQDKLKVEVRNKSVLSIAESRITTLDVTLDGSAQFTADQASISAANVFMAGHPDVSLGNIKTLTVKSPEACAANASSTVSVQNILSATYEYNGTQTASRSMEDPCYKMTVASDDARTYEYQY